MSSEFGFRYGKSMHKILTATGLNKREFIFKVEITNWRVVIV